MESRTVKQVLEDSKELYGDKEDDYGESWRLTGKILSLIIEQQNQEEIVIPSDPDYLIALGLYTRRLDKLVRSFNATFIQEEVKVDESVAETVGDQVPYAAMQTEVSESLTERESQMESAKVEKTSKKGYEHCSECGGRAADRIPIETEQEEPDFEYYCSCGNAWWGDEKRGESSRGGGKSLPSFFSRVAFSPE